MSQTHGSLRGEARGDVFAVHCDGQELRLDEAHTAAFAAELGNLAQQSDGPEFRVDLGNVTVLSTPALVVLVKLRRQLLARGRRLALCNLRPAVAEVFEVSRLSRLFPIHRDAAGRPAASAPAPGVADASEPDARRSARFGPVPPDRATPAAEMPARRPEQVAEPVVP
jgi:anti-anti-sigma factor